MAHAYKNEALAKQEGLEQQLHALTADFSDHEPTEESLDQRIADLATERDR